MRSLLSRFPLIPSLFFPLIELMIWLVLFYLAFRCDAIGINGRIAGTMLIAVAMWGWNLLIAAGWTVPGSTATERRTRLSEAMRMKAEPGKAPSWNKQISNVLQSHIYVVSGIGGLIVGCIVAILLDGLDMHSLPIWGGGFGVMGLMAPAMIQLQDARHPHHQAFEAVVSHTFRVTFVALFALGIWQPFRAGLVFVLAGFLYSACFFLIGALWSLALLGQTALRSVQC